MVKNLALQALAIPLMKNTARKNITMVTALAIALAIGCGTYEDGPNFSLRTKKARLIGTWIVKEAANQPTDSANIELEFESDGDFSYSLKLDFFPISQSGEWNWEDGKEKLEINVDGNTTE